MQIARFKIGQRSVQPLVVVLVDELGHESLSGKVVASVVVVAVLPYGAVEALDDAVRLRMAGAGADVQQVVDLDDGAQLGVADLLPPPQNRK